MSEAKADVAGAQDEGNPAHEILAMALRHVRDAEIFWAREEAIGTSCTDGGPRAATRREGEGVALRVISAGRIGFAVHLGPLGATDGIALLREAMRRAAEGPEAPPTFWKEREAGAAGTNWDDDVAALGPAEVAHLARQASLRLTDLLGTLPSEVAVRRVIRQTRLVTRSADKHAAKTILQFRGQLGPLPTTSAVLTDTWASCRYPDDPMAWLGELTWKAALAGETARTVAGDRAVVLSPRATSTILRWACAGLTGSSWVTGTSPLQGALGENVFDPRLCLADDAAAPWAPGGAPYDAEGVARRRQVLVEGGILRGLLLDLPTAWKLSLPPTGSAVRSMDTPPVAAPSHLLLRSGDMSVDDLLGSAEGGLYVDSLSEEIGPDALGDVVVPIQSGFAVRRGRPCGWVEGLALAGNVFEWLRHHVSGVGSNSTSVVGARCPSLALRAVSVVPTGSL